MDEYMKERLESTNETLDSHPDNQGRILRDILRNQKAIMLFLQRTEEDE